MAGHISQLIDPKPATYYFDYDAMDRKIGATYPLDATGANCTESWHYDFAGNMDGYTNPAGQIKTLGYDTRNRLYTSSWNSGDGQTVGLGYDNASRLTIVTTNTNETTVVFGYDDANRQTWEEQTVAGYPTRHIDTPRNDDGERMSLSAPGFPLLRYDYTGRGQLRTISDTNFVPWIKYSYDLSGNMAKRQTLYGGVNDSTNVMDAAGVSQYDALNRPMMWEQTGTVNGTHDSAFARSHFGYDNLSRLTGSWRDEQAGKGEWFGYHATGQLTDVAYNADNVSSGTPQNATRTVNYTMTADTLNRSTMTDTGELSVYSPNALNQYTDLNGGGLYYDGNFNLMWTGGFSAGYDADKRLVAIASGEDYGQFVYDGLGRCLKRTIDWETILITYDGWKPIVEWDQWNGLKAWNVYGPGPDEILYRHDAYLAVDLRYHLDRMGNVAFVLNAAGDGIERYTYDAFGSPTVTDWDGNNPRPYSWFGNRFMFTGREYFPELGLYDYRNRFYHPVLGRFLQSDPIRFSGGDANLFRYCGGDPVNRKDPNGTQFFIPRDGEVEKGYVYMMNEYGLVLPLTDSDYAETARQNLEMIQTVAEIGADVAEKLFDIAVDHFFLHRGIMLPKVLEPDIYGARIYPKDARNRGGENSFLAATGLDVTLHDWLVSYSPPPQNPGFEIQLPGEVIKYDPLPAGPYDRGGSDHGVTYGAYGSSTSAAANWEASWGTGSAWGLGVGGQPFGHDIQYPDGQSLE